MEDTSRSHVTITLGRSGHVVKRSGAAVDNDFLDPVPASGIKRPVRDRLGSNVDAVHLDNKRQCGINGRLIAKASNGVDDTHLSKHDLRFKIMKKSQIHDKKKNVDLRDMLSQKACSSSTNHKNHQSSLEPGTVRHGAPHLSPDLRDGHWDPIEVQVRPRDDRRLVRDPIEVGPRDDRRLVRDPIEVGPRDDRRLVWGSVEVGSREGRRIIRDPVDLGPRNDRRDRQLIRVPIEVDPRMHTRYDDIQPNLDPTDGSIPSRLTSTRTSRTLSQMDLSKNSFTLETLDHISRPPPPPPPPPPLPPTEEPLRRPLMRAFNDPRPVPYTSRDIHEIPRPMATSTSFHPIKPAISNGLIKPVGPLVGPQLPTGGMVQQSPYPVDYLSLEGFLHSLGLEKYLISFKVEEVDMATLSQMGENDLKEMSIPMGPRKKILLALHARNRRPA